MFMEAKRTKRYNTGFPTVMGRRKKKNLARNLQGWHLKDTDKEEPKCVSV